MKTNFVLVFGLFSLASLGANATASQCLKYEPAVVSLTGAVVRETHPGPPNYEDVTKGDTPETIWVLKLEESICVHPEDEVNMAEKDIQEIQLVLQPEQYAQYRALVGLKVKASGSLFHSHTGHHHKRLLLKTRELEGYKSN